MARDAVDSYGINEYPPITHWCSFCGGELEDEAEVYETEFGVMCEDCFYNFCKINLDLHEMAELWNIPVRKACET